MSKFLPTVLIASALFAAAPKTISYQGVLTDSKSMPKPDGSYDITYSLYADTATASPYLWRSKEKTAVIGGLFNAILGSTVPFDTLSFSRPYYLGIQVGTDAELTPRIALSSAGYAIRAMVADSAVSATTAVTAQNALTIAPNSVGAANIVNGSILTEDLSPAFVAPLAANSKIADVALSVAGTAIAPKSITAAHLADGLVVPVATKADLATKATTADLATKATTADLATKATTADLATKATTAESVAGGAITGPIVTDTIKAKTLSNLNLLSSSGKGIVIDTVGNVMVGTTDNPKIMSVNGTLAVAGAPLATRNSSTNYLWSQPNGSLKITNGAGLQDLVTIMDGGNVGIGTNAPTAKLEVSGSDYVFKVAQPLPKKQFTALDYNSILFARGDGIYPSGTHAFVTGGTGHQLYFGTLSKTRAVIDSIGNMGVGTETPTAKLEVVGDLKVSGNIISQGNVSSNRIHFSSSVTLPSKIVIAPNARVDVPWPASLRVPGLPYKYVFWVNVEGNANYRQETTIKIYRHDHHLVGGWTQDMVVGSWTIYGRDYDDNYIDVNISKEVPPTGYHIDRLSIENTGSKTLEIFAVGVIAEGVPNNSGVAEQVYLQ